MYVWRPLIELNCSPCKACTAKYITTGLYSFPKHYGHLLLALLIFIIYIGYLSLERWPVQEKSSGCWCILGIVSYEKAWTLICLPVHASQYIIPGVHYSSTRFPPLLTLKFSFGAALHCILMSLRYMDIHAFY